MHAFFTFIETYAQVHRSHRNAHIQECVHGTCTLTFVHSYITYTPSRIRISRMQTRKRRHDLDSQTKQGAI